MNAGQMRSAVLQIRLNGVERRAAKRHNSFLVAFAAHQHAARVHGQIASAETNNFRYAQATRIKQLENGAIAKGCGFCLRMFGGEGGALKHLGDFRLGEGLGQDFPGLGAFDIERGIVMDAAIEEQPLVEAAQAA